MKSVAGTIYAGLIIVTIIMTNKIKDQRGHQANLNAYNCHNHSHNKITQSLVHQMIEKISTSDSSGNHSSFIMGHQNIKEQNLPKSFINIKKQIVRSDVSPSRVGAVQRESKSKLKNTKEANTKVDSCNRIEIKDYRKKCSEGVRVSAGKSSDFTSFLADKIKNIKQKRYRQHMGQQSSFNSLYYGLNVMQIKKIQVSDREQPKEKEGCQIKPKTATISKPKGELHYSTKNRIKTSSFNHYHTFDNQSGQLLSNKHIILSQHKLEPGSKQTKLKPKTRILEIKQYQQKIQKMLDCMDIILNSYHCTLVSNKKQAGIKPTLSNTTSEGMIKPLVNKEKGKYLYYVGHGNNANLIRSLLRKRSWWVEVDSIAKANLVWTQLKVASVLEKIELHIEEDWSKTITLYEQINGHDEGKNCSSTNKSGKKIVKPDSRVSQQSLDLLFHKKQSKRYRSLLDAKEVQIRLEHIYTPKLIHNHYQHNYMFGNKNALYYNISAYCEFTQKDQRKLVPLTFYLQQGNKKAISDFQKVFNELKKNSSVWILKPAQNSNRGNGIQVTNSIKQIKVKLNHQKKLIVQHYIKNMLLYNYRKFDIRAYMIAVTINGRTKYFWYEEGYIRTSSEIYDLDNLRDEFIHLTNDAVQVKGQNYGKYQEGNKLSYSEFQRYLDTRFPRQSWKMTSLHEQMKLVALESVKATYCRLDPTKKNFSFELFGLDFIVDNQFTPFLIEVNTNPCLELSSPVLARLIPRMMENMFRIAIDPLFRPSIDISYAKSQLYYLYDEKFLTKNRFSLIFDEKYDRDFQWEERCKNMEGLQWNNHEEEQYSNEGRIIVVNY